MSECNAGLLSSMLSTLTAYRKLVADPVVASLRLLLDAIARETPLTGDDEARTFAEPAIPDAYGAFLSALLEANPHADLHAHLLKAALLDENAFTNACMQENVPDVLMSAAAHDLKVIRSLALLSSAAVKRRMTECGVSAELAAALPGWSVDGSFFAEEDRRLPDALATVFGHDWADAMALAASDSRLAEAVRRFHRRQGTGPFVGVHGFLWECRDGACALSAVRNPDPILLSDFVGYQAERAVVVDNTVALLGGRPANNMLLYGARGTGKSSTVKALLNEYGRSGLRVIELTRDGLTELPRLIRRIAGQPLKFILFIDDLAFEGAEDTYTPLKAIIEGGLESRPGNTVIYATSNRRHLVKERFSERSAGGSADPDDDVRAMDARQEKLSLADRFGMTVTFLPPDQETYLTIAESLVRAAGVDADREEIRREALRWEMRQNGRSPRTARQFADWFAARSGN